MTEGSTARGAGKETEFVSGPERHGEPLEIWKMKERMPERNRQERDAERFKRRKKENLN